MIVMQIRLGLVDRNHRRRLERATFALPALAEERPVAGIGAVTEGTIATIAETAVTTAMTLIEARLAGSLALGRLAIGLSVKLTIALAILAVGPVLAGLPVFARLAFLTRAALAVETVIAVTEAMLTLAIRLAAFTALAEIAVTSRLHQARLLVETLGAAELIRRRTEALRHRGDRAIEIGIVTLFLVFGTMAEGLVAGELRLGRRDNAEIVLGVLQIGLGQDRVAGGLGIARQLNVFFSDMGGGSTNLHVGAVRLIAPAQRVRTLAAA